MNIYTWNMEHANPNWGFLSQFANLDAVCLQETGARMTRMIPDRHSPRNIHGELVYFGMIQIGRYNFMRIALAWFRAGQNSLAVATRDTHAPFDIEVIPPPAANTRATIGLQLAPPHQDTWVYSIHAPSKQGSAWQMEWIARVLAAIDARGHARWICAGDYNASPAAVGALCPPEHFVVDAGQATHQKGGNYDFAVCKPLIVNRGAVMSNHGGDHWPVQLWREA
ncbi:endonuclease/exonuclease/phosphatase family protein [Sorangium sp. So ce131]|uniref:endonuclease/exonuclease/phosphatase family protein n=1 Tax=Sorangium sp. So ce131 TaxID=3133282 RepID=UPI003F5E4280